MPVSEQNLLKAAVTRRFGPGGTHAHKVFNIEDYYDTIALFPDTEGIPLPRPYRPREASSDEDSLGAATVSVVDPQDLDYLSARMRMCMSDEGPLNAYGFLSQ
jgi:hypothetical protein